ncbi:MAG: hypothetical protein ACFFDI_15030, partial [Promethearchaeota archaeon]
VDEFNIQIYDVSELTENEAKELFFLVSKLNEEDPKILKIADKILNTIGRHPLNVRLAAMYCQSEQIASSYVENYHKININFKTLTPTVANVMRTFKMAVDTITSEAKTAAAVVSAFSSGAPPRLLTSILGDEWSRSIFETIRYGLVFNSAGRYRMLEPLRQSLIALNDQSLDEMRRKAMNKSILYYSDELAKYQRQRDIGKTLASNAWALYDETGNLVDAFNWAANQQHEKLFDMLYNSYDYTSWAGPIFDKREWVTTAFDLLEKKSSKGSIELEEHARYQLMFARILDRYGDPVSWTNAIEYYIKTEELFRRILQQKPKDPNIRESLAFVKSTLACLLTWTGGNENLKRAVNELEEAIQICRELVAENQSAISNLSLFLNNFGWILNTMGGSQTYLRGINVLKEALEIRKELAQQRADMDWWLGRTELNLGTVLDSYGSPEGAAEAEELFKQAIKRYRRLWSYTPGAALPLAMALVYSGLMYWRKNTRKGRNTAFSHFTEALDIYRKWAEGNPGARYEVAWAARFLGNLYRTGIDGLPTIEQLQDALALLDEAISIYESVIAHRPGGKTDAAITKADKALVLAALGQEQEALQILEEVQPEFEEDSKQRQCALLNLAELRHQMAEILRRQTTPRSFETRNTYMKKLKNTWYLVQRLVKQSPSSSSEDISADHTPIQADSISKTILEHYKAAFDLSRVQAEEFPGAVSCFFDIAKDYASYLREIGRAEEAGNVESSLQKFGRDKKFIKNYGRLEFKGLSGK